MRMEGGRLRRWRRVTWNEEEGGELVVRGREGMIRALFRAQWNMAPSYILCDITKIPFWTLYSKEDK